MAIDPLNTGKDEGKDGLPPADIDQSGGDVDVDDFAGDEPTLVTGKPSAADGKKTPTVLENVVSLARVGINKATAVGESMKKATQPAKEKVNAYQLINKTVSEGVKLVEAELKKPENAEIAADPIKRKDFVIKFLHDIDNVKFSPEVCGGVNEAIENRVIFAKEKAEKKVRAQESAEKANTAKEKKPSKSFKADKLLLASTLAMHAGTSVIGSVAGGTWTVIKGSGRLVKEEVISVAKGTVDLGIQAGKTVVYPFGRIGFGAKNRFMRGLNWALAYPAKPNLIKSSNEPAASEEVKKDETKKSKIGSGFSSVGRGIANLTKRAWYRTKQATLLLTAAPLGLIAGTVEGAALAIPRDIIGIHTEGEASVRETGKREIDMGKMGKYTDVDGGVLGMGYSIYKFGHGIFVQAPINAFEEQLTMIKIEETPVAADETQPAPAAPTAAAAPESSGGGSADTPPKAERKQSKGSVNTDKKKGFLAAFKVVRDAWRDDDLSSEDFEKAVDAMDEAFGKEDGSVAGGMAKGLRSLFGPSDKIPVN